jgi:hypothetical protein
MAQKLNSQTVGNIGLYYVCYRLSRRGWNAMPTTRNARGIDILIYDQDAERKLSIQVKSLSKPSPVPLGKHLDNLFADFVIICRNACDDQPECFILTADEIRDLAHRGEKDGRVSYWLQPPQYAVHDFCEKWDRIGDGTSGRLTSRSS